MKRIYFFPCFGTGKYSRAAFLSPEKVSLLTMLKEPMMERLCSPDVYSDRKKLSIEEGHLLCHC